MPLIVGLRELGSASGSPPAADDPDAGLKVARSIVISRAEERAAHLRPMPRVLSRSVIRQRWAAQQEGAKQRTSMPVGHERRPHEIVEPPYDLHALAQLLEDSPDFAAVVEQLATDVAGRGWDLIDAEDPWPEPGEPHDLSPAGLIAQDAELTRQRVAASEWLRSLPRDFMGQRISLEDLSKNASIDFEALGEGYIEVAPEPAAGGPDGGPPVAATQPTPAQLYHLHGVHIRKREDGTFVQLDIFGREAAYFRAFGSDPNAPTSRYDRAEAARVDGIVERALKNELYELRRYHPNELYYGLPLIVSALAAVRGNIFCDDRSIRYFVNRALPDWIVELKATRATINAPPDRNLLDRYEEAIREHMHYILQGDDYRTLVLRLPTGEVETTWTKLTTEFEPAGLDAYQLRNRDVIIRVYRVPPRMLGIIETASLGSGTGESQEETYKRSHIDPRQERLEDFFDRLLDRVGLTRVRFKYRDIDVVDEVREMQILTMAWATGLMSVNQGLRWLSRIVQDQDFPDVDEDMADTPIYLIEAQAASTAAANGGGLGGFGRQPEPAGAGAGDGRLPAIGQPAPAPPQAARTLAFDPDYASIRRRVQERLGQFGVRRARLLAIAGGGGAAGNPVPAAVG